MLKFLFCCLPLSCFALDTPTVTKFEYELHSYLCFNGSQIVHDPNCRCSEHFTGFVMTPSGQYYWIELSSRGTPIPHLNP